MSHSDAERDAERLLVWTREQFCLESTILNWNTDMEERTERGRAFNVDTAADCWLERPFTDGGANCPWHNQVSIDDAERSSWRVCTSKTHCSSEVRYSGAEPWRKRYVSTASRNVIRSATRNHCRLWSSGVMWSLRFAAKTRRAAASWTYWSLSNNCFGRPTSTVLPYVDVENSVYDHRRI